MGHSVSASQAIISVRQPLAYKVLEVIEERSREAEKVIKAARKSGTIYFAFRRVPTHIFNLFQSLKLAGGLPGLFALPEFVKKIKKAFVHEKKTERVRAAFEAVSTAKDITYTAIEMTQGLEGAGALAKDAASWAIPVQTILLPFEAIGLTFACIDLWNTNKSWHELKDINVRANESVALAALDLVSNKEKKIKDLAMLGSKAPIRKVTDKLMKDIREGNAIEKAQAIAHTEALVDELKGRVKKKIAFSIFDLVVKIASVVIGVLLIFSPAAPLLLGLGAAVSLIGIGFWFYKKYGVKKTIASLEVVIHNVPVPPLEARIAVR